MMNTSNRYINGYFPPGTLKGRLGTLVVTTACLLIFVGNAVGRMPSSALTKQSGKAPISQAASAADCDRTRAKDAVATRTCNGHMAYSRSNKCHRFNRFHAKQRYDWDWYCGPNSKPETDNISQRQAMKIDKFIKRMISDPLFSKVLLQKLKNDPTVEGQKEWVIALAVAQPNALSDAILEMIRNPDTDVRATAYELIEKLPLPGDHLAVIGKQIIDTAVDPDAVAAGVAALRISRTTDSKEVTQAEIDAAMEFAYNPDPRIRSEGITYLAQLDKSANIELALLSLLTDENLSVQLAAIEAVVASGLLTVSIKDKLLELCGDGAMEFEVRAFAINVLESFDLSIDERQALNDAHNSLW